MTQGAIYGCRHCGGPIRRVEDRWMHTKPGPDGEELVWECEGFTDTVAGPPGLRGI